MDVNIILELGKILRGVLDGDFSMLSTEGSLAGNDSAAEAGGSLVGSVIGSLGLEDAVGDLPTNWWEAIGSAVGG